MPRRRGRVRSPYVCTGYDGPPGPLRRDPDGFATVGDRGELVDGRLRVAGRADAVTAGGRTVETADVEALLRAAGPGRGGRARRPAPAGWARCWRWCSRTCATTRRCDGAPGSGSTAARRPRLWFCVPRLPSTPAGKVDRVALAALVSGDDARARRLV